MSKAYFYLLLSLLSLSFSKISHASTKTESAQNLAKTFDIDAKLENFNSEQEKKILKAIEVIKKVVASEEFKQKILNHTVAGKKTFLENNGLTNEQIYQKILEGAEDLNPEKNNKMDVELVLYSEKAKTIGYTYPNVRKIWMNKSYFSRFTPIQVSDNLMHEWMHKLGFDHEVKYSKTRQYSVPYAIGYLVRELAPNLN